MAPASNKRRWSALLGLACLAVLPAAYQLLAQPPAFVPAHAEETLARCEALHKPAGPPDNFHDRTQSDRFVPGTPPTLIKNARIWTGLHNGTEVIEGDVLLDGGLIVGVGHFSSGELTAYGSLKVVDAAGAWVTPGIVDIHSHLGDGPSPALDGAEDDNSLKGTAQPWLRSLDGLNTHDDSYRLSISGGVTTALVLPGSANAIGGQAFPIKLRHTDERSPTSMLLEPPFTINASVPDPALPPRWRHMKHACGENPSRVYKDTRLDTAWAYRNAYNTAFQLKKKQDDYCEKATAGKWEGLGKFPDDLQWEALVDVVRGRVKVNVHCYEAVDLDDMVRLTNEFQFPIAAFHHAHETYLVPDLLKKTYGGTPAVALFATNGRYKREAYRQSEFAPKIHASNGITVLMKSDHPVLNSRFLLYEAQQAHYYGLADNLAIASVTSNSAVVMGMGHRIGFVRKGWDADLVIWDSHPLALGATPAQVFIDGVAQLDAPFVYPKPQAFQEVPRTPNFDEEAKEAVEFDGLPPLETSNTTEGLVAFVNVHSVFSRENGKIQLKSLGEDGDNVVIVRAGRVICEGARTTCFTDAILNEEPTVFDLEGGSLSPGLTTFGAPVGLESINQEPSTNDGVVWDALSKGDIPKIAEGLVRAVDGLQFSTRDALIAYRYGVTHAITAPVSYGFFSGLGTAFATGVSNKLQKGAILKEVTAVHVSVSPGDSTSVSTQIAALRKLLLSPPDGDTGSWFAKVVDGEIPLVVEAHSADIIATLVLLKREIEEKKGQKIRLTITGAQEAHLLAKELGEADIGVILKPARGFPTAWEDRRILPGPPLTKHTAATTLLEANVTLGIGTVENWDTRNLRLDVGWTALEAAGGISKEEALALASTSLEKLLGAEVTTDDSLESPRDMVATKGGDLLSLEAKVVGVISPCRGVVDFL
ncbi:carbohydrate esterase family 9 protein [Cylindrobasidium torrendii FP15055 ss-10]|uniref:Carbohydrate esterase family 9 protein n=1 Tax=Cylindrobasidium torrendii FP15055 ss-10 TaxID=1314674 RepID=A0A0D7BL07_9AGAR|nr:carbohydrate esterase family 9 protein [Cylindrobasidium torrendii FP15055 ss-10]